MYIALATAEYPLTDAEIIKRHPNTSFPVPFEPPDGYAFVEPAERSEYDAETEKAVEAAPVQVEGVWTRQWTIEPLTDGEKAERATMREQDRRMALASVKQRLAAARIRLSTAPIEYDGKNVDADPTAQTNIASKLAEITARRRLGSEMPAPLLIWRDADNITHSFPSMDAYEDWLLGLTIAIAERATVAYVQAWLQGAAFDAMETSEEIMAAAEGIEP